MHFIHCFSSFSYVNWATWDCLVVIFPLNLCWSCFKPTCALLSASVMCERVAWCSLQHQMFLNELQKIKRVYSITYIVSWFILNLIRCVGIRFPPSFLVWSMILLLALILLNCTFVGAIFCIWIILYILNRFLNFLNILTELLACILSRADIGLIYEITFF